MKCRIAFCAVLAWPLVVSADSTFTLSTGIDYSTGKYGDSRSTDTVYVPFIGKYESGGWTLRATVPWLRMTGPGGVVGSGADRVTVATTGSGRRRTESGQGDVVLAASYTVFSSTGWTAEAGAKVKLPTASESRGLGTGETDYTVQLDLYRSLGRGSLFGTVGYKWMGDPDGVNFDNPLFASLGFAGKACADTTVGLSVDWRDRMRAGSEPIREMTVFASRRIDNLWKAQLYAVTGFTDASPDFGLGFIVGRLF